LPIRKILGHSMRGTREAAALARAVPPSVGSSAPEQPADHAADQANRTAATAVAATMGRMAVIGFVAGAGARMRRWGGFIQQGLMLAALRKPVVG
jgi:hypothetical protein